MKSAKTKQQINRNMQENLCMAYVKFFIIKFTDETWQAFCKRNELGSISADDLLHSLKPNQKNTIV